MATERTRKQILDVAERLFLQLGPRDASMRQITQAAGVGLAAVNYHFGSKENLIAEVATRLTAELWGEQERALGELDRADAPPTMEAIVAAFLGPYGKFLQGHDGRERIGLVMQVLGGPPSRAREELIVSLEPLEQVMLSVVRRAHPCLGPEELGFRIGSLVAVVLFYLQGGFAPTANPSGVPRSWAQDSSFLVSHLSTMLDAPPGQAAQGGGRRRRIAAA